MWDNFFGRRIRRSARRRLLAGLLLWLIAGLLAASCRRYVYNVAFGPFPADAATLVRIDDADARFEYFVETEKGEVKTYFPRAYTRGKEPYAVYAVLAAGDRRLLLRLPARHQGPHLSGTLEGLSDFERDHVLARHPDGPAAFLPYRLDAVRPFRPAGLFLAALPLTALSLTGGWLIVIGALRLRNPAGHPVARALARLGRPDEVAGTVSAELPTAWGMAGVALTPTWLVHVGDAVVLRRDEIVSCERQTLRGDAVLHRCLVTDRHGVCLQAAGPPEEVDRLAAELAARLSGANVEGLSGAMLSRSR